MSKALYENVTNSYVFNEDSSHNKFYCENFHAYTLHLPEVEVPLKKCPENIQQMARRSLMPKCDFEKVVLQFY